MMCAVFFQEKRVPSNRNGLDAGKPLSIVILGASGDLAQKKIIPALFALYSQEHLPKDVNIFGFARTALSDDEFRKKVVENLTCRYVPGKSCADWMNQFLARCHYVAGQYDSTDSFLDLFQVMKQHEGGAIANRLYYLAIPPSIFIDVVHSLGGAGLVSCGPALGWSRIVIEKPFGRDRASSDRMAKELSQVSGERDIYRIDHYLGKEIVQNLMVLRFANTIFEPLWSREHIESVRITWKENFGIGGRAGYFDQYGIIRDVMQNHLIQIASLIAMEEPSSLGAQFVRDEKVRVLKSISAVTLDDLVVGQYKGAVKGSTRLPAYAEEPGVPPGSITPTFAAAVLKINNDRWQGVPFFIKAGKGLDTRVSEIRIQFRPKARNIFSDIRPALPDNALVIRVQPDEAIYFRIVNKQPGLKLELVDTDLDLKYVSTFSEPIPEAYEALILDALRGDKGVFIRNDEVAAAWDIFTPALHELEEKAIKPELYDFGGTGPAAADALAARYKLEGAL
jgi:glucose-6-phosphate 1-dehydrogenase